MSDARNSDQAFILFLTEIVVKNLKNENFGIKDLAREAGLSSSTLNRRLNRTARKTGNQFIREIRLRKAHEMLREKSVNVSEVSYAVGFSSPAYFSACFHEYFGYPPRNVIREGTVSQADDTNAAPAEQKRMKKSFREFLNSSRIWIISFVFATIGIILFIFPLLQGRTNLDDLRSSDGRIPVAVMPFENLTGNRTWDCMQLNLISYLSGYDELTVRQKEAVDMLLAGKGNPGQASITPSLASSISKRLDSKIYISGVISKAGTRSRINVQIVNSHNREVIKSFQIEDLSDEHRIFRMIDSVSVCVKNFLVTEKMVSETNPDLRPYRYTNSPAAFEYFVKADEAIQKQDTRKSLYWYLRAVEADSGFIPAIIFLSMRYGELEDYEEAKKWCLKAYAMKDHAHLKEKYMIEWYHAVLFGTPDEEVRFLRQYVALDDNVPIAYWQTGNAYSKLLQYKNAIPEYEKTLEIYKKWNVRPMMIQNYLTLTDAYHQTHQYTKEKKLIAVAARTFPEESWMLLRNRAILAFAEGDPIQGDQYVEKYRSEMASGLIPAPEIYSEIASLYNESGNIAEAEKNLREAWSLCPDDPARINNLAYLLIDKEINISEGLNLAAEGLKIKPDDHGLLHTLGWGVAKTGSYTEALEILNKSWDLRPQYSHSLVQHIGQVQKQVLTTNQITSGSALVQD
jgi:AraC-like DNA-binding protein/tetratricopeptide (TPR) repeat protein/TolB-like protein